MALSPSILASAQNFSITVNILGKLWWHKFRWSWAKIKGICPSVALLPQNGQNLGWAPENNLYLGKRNYFWGWVQWKSCSPGRIDDMPNWNLQFQNKKLTFCPELSKFGVLGSPAGQCCLIGSLIWKYQKFCSQYWIDYSGLTINYAIMFDFKSLTETLHLEFTDCRKIVELSWLTHVWLNQVTCLDF